MHYEEFVTAPGLPPVYLDFTTKQLNESSDLADQYIALKGQSSPDNYADFYEFYSSLKVVFVERLVTRSADVDLAILSKVDADYNLTMTLDPEVKQRWFPLGIRAGYQPVFAQANKFVSTQGRLKYLTPIYQALLDAGKKDVATEWFHANEDFYHPMAVAKIAKLLGLDQQAAQVMQERE